MQWFSSLGAKMLKSYDQAKAFCDQKIQISQLIENNTFLSNDILCFFTI